METKKSCGSSSKTQIDRPIHILLTIMVITAIALMAMGLTSCNNDDNTAKSDFDQTGTIMGSVKDPNGNPYPSALVKLSKGSDKLERATNAEGIYEKKTNDIGTYEVTLVPPLATEAVSVNPISTNVEADQTTTVDFVIQPQPVKAHLNFGNVQLLEEIVDENGNTPTQPNEPLYAANIFDEPLGSLTAIKAPDGHQLTLSEFQTAKGHLTVRCNGNFSTVEVALEGMIPNGTYTFWLAYLNKTRKVGEQIDFANDFVNQTNPPVGASDGTENIVIAGTDGTISTTLEHSSCILTDEAALVIPVLYHINGKTFGGGHVPDPEEMVHMLVYFQ